MKFVGEVIGNVQGIQYFYIVGLLIFIALFVVIVYKTFKIPKKDLEGFKTSIFDKDEIGNGENSYLKSANNK